MNRKDFPILEKDIVYLDSACMSLRPRRVIDKIREYYMEYSGCAGRSAHKISKRLEGEVEKARKSVKKLIGAKEGIVFSKNATESLNLVYHGLDWEEGDVIITTGKEHNSNLLPIQRLEREKKVVHRILKPDEDGSFNLENFKEALQGQVKMVSLVHTSNLDGTTVPDEVVKLSHDFGAKVLLDGAQSVPHKKINVKKLGVDFLAFSGHKMLGPTGTGVLYANCLEEMKPFILGGETVYETTYNSAKLEKPPMKFEAGLQNYAGIVGLGEAARYLRKNLSKIKSHEVRLNKKMSSELDVELIGPAEAEKRGSIFNFNIKGIDAHEVAGILNEQDIYVRAGAHCVHSWYNAHDLKGSCRASLYLYNNEEDVDKFIEAVKKVKKLVG